MATYLRPGSYVEERLTQSSTTVSGVSLSAAAFVATNGRGPSAVTRVESWSQFTRLYGEFDIPNGSNRLPHAVYSYFSNGGRVAHISRALGTGAAPASRTLMDRSGGAVPTLRVDALSEGDWGEQIFIDVENYTDTTGTAVEGRFNINVYYGGTAPANRVERHTNLSMEEEAGGRMAVLTVNQSSFYIRLVDLASPTAAPDNIPLAVAAAALTGGDNGAAPTTTQIMAAVEALDVVEEPFGLNLPGESTVAVLTAARAWAEARGDVMMVIDPAEDMPPTAAGGGVIAYAQSLGASSYSAVYYPWIHVSDPASTRSNASVKIPPGGAVLGQYALTDIQRGVHKAPAGVSNRISGAVSLERRLTNSELDLLNESGVNAIRLVPGTGICVFGARTLKSGDSSMYVPVRRSLIYIKRALLDGTRFAAFEPNDERLWFRLRSEAEQFLRGFWQEGGLRGTDQAQAFYVKCDGELNTPEVIDAGEVRMEVGVALQRPAEFVVITIGQFEGGSTANES